MIKWIKIKNWVIFIGCLSAILFSCSDDHIIEEEIGLIAENAMVVSAREEASAIGIAILKKGGNAFDAMIATDLALVVAFPFAGNIGGGGFTVYRKSNGEVGALDYREKAPLAAHRDMYLDDMGKIIPNKSILGAMAVGVPGTIAGLFEIHKNFATLPFSDLIQPAIDLAKKGVVVSENQAIRLNNYRHLFVKANKRTILFDREWHEGDTIRNLKLAKTFERIKENGRAEFYEGQTGEQMVSYIQELGGILTLEDLVKYEAKWRNPIEFEYKDVRVISMPPPSSGGVCIAQILKSIEPYDIGQLKHNSTEYIQLLVEAERRVYADRSFFLGDPDFNDIPVEDLISEEYNQNRMANFQWAHATPSSEINRGDVDIIESNETTHYSIIDQFGNAVAVTNTLNGAYGSKVYVEEGGYFLNNEMDDLSIKVGEPNMFGLIGAKANSIEPEKRMLSSMTPTIVEQHGKLKMVLGAPGGSTIITTVVQNIINVIDFEMGMQESVNKSRFHHQWMPEDIRFEPSFDTTSFKDLRDIGYKIDQRNSRILGLVDAILVLPNGSLEGGADPRGDDKAVGF